MYIGYWTLNKYYYYYYAGWYINDKCINHSMHADDICLTAPTCTTMQNLIDVCHNNGTENVI